MSLRTRGETAAEEEVIRVKRNGARITVRLDMNQADTESPLHDVYGIDPERYNLHRDYEFPEKIRGLIPEGTPPYIQGDHDYVRQIVRALYYF
ncbi:MAG: hypothetical protein JSW53_02895, partial [Candidatus Bathyarchaeota archaeon]